MFPDPDAIETTVDNKSEGYGKIAVNNLGSVAGFLDLTTFSVINNENAGTVSEAETNTDDPGDLDVLIDVWMFWDDNGDGDFDSATDVDIYGAAGAADNDGFAEATPVKLSTMSMDKDLDFPVAASSTTNISLYWRWPDGGSSDNAAQGDSATLSFTVDLGQTDD